jgi:hypothetical protein
MLGKAALAMWWDVAPEWRRELEHWHAHEHFPERLGLPGFLRATRWTSAEGGDGFFVMYELQDYGILASPAYVARLDAPTPWSARMMPHHGRMLRSQCRVLESQGAVTARYAFTVRFSPATGQADALQRSLGELARSVRMRPGLVGLHLLRHETPPLAVTTEQKIRGNGDRVADWVLVACGYDASALRVLGEGELADGGLQTLGAAQGSERHLYELAYSATPADVG